MLQNPRFCTLAVIVVYIQRRPLPIPEDCAVSRAPRAAQAEQSEEILPERRLQVPRLAVPRPVPLAAELVAQMPPEIPVLVHPPAAPGRQYHQCQGDGEGPVDPE